MTKRELERKHKALEKHFKQMKAAFEDGYRLDNIERINDFKYYSGYDSYKHKKRVRSISISYLNDDFITQIQQEAKEVGNFIGKDVIINIALYKLREEKEEKHLDNFNDWVRTYLK